MSHEFLDAVISALPELHEDDRGHLRDALEEWYSSQPGELPPIDAAIRELRQRLGLPVVDEPVAEEPVTEEPVVEEPVVEEPVVEQPVVEEPVVEEATAEDSEPDEKPEPAPEKDPEPAPKRGLKFWRLASNDPKTLLIVGAGLVASGVAFGWWNASPAFTLDTVAIDSETIEVMWVDSDDPSRVVRCSPGELEVAARILTVGRTTLDSVALPLLDGEWSSAGSVERVSAEISPVGSDESFPVAGYNLGQSGNNEHDIRLIYRISDCDQIEAMPSATALTINYRFHGRDQSADVKLPERLAFIDEDCRPKDLEAGDCPSS